MSTMTVEAYDALRQGHRKRSHAKQQRRLQLTKTALIGSRTLRKGRVPQFAVISSSLGWTSFNQLLSCCFCKPD